MATESIDIVVTETGARTVRRNLEDIGEGAKSAKGAIDVLKSALAVLGGALAVDQLRRYADAWTDVTNALKNATRSADELRIAQARLFDISQQTRQSLSGNVQLYQRLTASSLELGASQERMLRFIEGVGKALAAGGINATQASGALMQLSQALGGGTVRAEEFNSILEGAKPILQAVADGIKETGGSVSKLRQLMLDGQLTSKLFFDAFLTQLPKLDSQFRQTSVTIGQALTVLDNALTKAIGQMDQTTGVSSALGSALIALASNMDVVIRAVAVLGAAVATALAARGIMAAVAGVGALTTALGALTTALGGPVGIALGVFGGLVASVVTRQSAAEKASHDHAEALKVVGSAADVASVRLAKTTAELEKQQRLQTQAKLDQARANQSATRSELYGGDYSISVLPLQLGQAAYADLRRLQGLLRDGKVDVEQFADALVTLSEKYEDNQALRRHVVELLKSVDGYRAATHDAGQLQKQMNGTASSTNAAGQAFVYASQGLGAMADKIKDVNEKVRLLGFKPGLERRVAEMVGQSPLGPDGRLPGGGATSSAEATQSDPAIGNYFYRQGVAKEVVNRQMTAEAGALVKVLKDLRKAEEDYQKAVGSGNAGLIAQAGAVKEVATMVANGELKADSAAGVLKEKLGIAVAQVGGQAAAAAVDLDLQTTALERMAAAAGLGEAAQRTATYAQREAEAATKGNVAVSAVRVANAREEAATVQSIRNETVRGLELETANTNRMAQAYVAGGSAIRAAQEAEYRSALVRKLGTDATVAGTKAQEALNDALRAWKENQAANDNSSIQQQIAAANDNLRIAELELSLGGRSEQQSARILELTRKELEIKREFPDASREYVDQLLREEAKLIDMRAQIDRQRQAWKTLTDSLERAFDRVGEALVNALVSGQRESIKWGDLMKGVIASIMSDLLKMAIAAPLKNWVFGTNTPTLWDAFGGSRVSGQANGQQGGTGSYSNVLTNWGMQKAGSWALDKVMPTGGIGGMIDTFGYNVLGIGTASYGTPLIGAHGMMTGGGATSLASPTGIAGGLSGYLGAAGAGAFGGMLGGMLGTATNSKAVGGLSGAALGAGSAYLASALGMGAMGGPIGLAVGAIVGGVMGLLGTQKKSTNYAAAYVATDAQGKTVESFASSKKSMADKLPEFEAAVKSAADAAHAIVRAGGLQMDGMLRLYLQSENGQLSTRLGGADSRVISQSDDPVRIAVDALRAILRGEGEATLSGNADVMAAIKNSSATTTDALVADLDFAKGFRDTIAAMTDSIGMEDTARKQGKQSADELAKAITDFRSKTKDLGLNIAEAAAATQQWIDTMVEGADPKTYTVAEAAVASVTAKWQNMGPVLQAVGYSAEAAGKKIKEGLTNELDKMRKAYKEDARTRVEALQGRDYLQGLRDLTTTYGVNRRNEAALGLDGKLADQEYTLGVTAVLKKLTVDQLKDVIAVFDGHVRDVAQGLLDTATAAASTAAATEAAAAALATFKENAEKAAQAEASYLSKMKAGADLRSRYYDLTGGAWESQSTRLRAQQVEELSAAAASGDANIGLLRGLQASEMARAKFQYEQQLYLSALDREIQARQESIRSLQEGTLAQKQAADQFRKAYDALAVSGDSPLGPGARMDELQRQFEVAFAVLQRSNATEADRSDARQQLLQLGPQWIASAKAVFGTADVSVYDRVRSVFDQLGTYSAGGAVDTAERALEEQQRALKVLEQQRDQAQRMGEQQYGALGDLKRNAETSLSTLNAMLSELKRQAPPEAPTPSAETKYLASNADVAAAVKAGSFYSGRQHYDLYGRAEGRLWNDELTSGMFTDATQRQLDAWVPVARSRNSPELLTAAFNRAVQLGSYWGRLSYAGPDHDGKLYSNWDERATGDALSFLRTLGYGGGYDVNANIFLQANNKGSEYSTWVEQYGRFRGWYGGGGYIGSGEYGVVGETGRPEVVFGPAYVANPDVTARMMGRTTSSNGDDVAREVALLREAVERLIAAVSGGGREAAGQRAAIGEATVGELSRLVSRIEELEDAVQRRVI